MRAGEALFILSGWGHCALNLEDTVAVTAKCASAANLSKVLKCLKTRNADLISRCPPAERVLPYDRFVAALREQCLEVLREWDACEKAAAGARASAAMLAAAFAPPAASTASFAGVAENDEDRCGRASRERFSFGFSL